MSSDVPVRLRPKVHKAPLNRSFFHAKTLSPLIRKATFSRCKRYRYLLEREWDDTKPKVLFIMLNPSTADHKQDDPTIRRCIGFAQELGFGSLIITNLFAYRATYPAELLKANEPTGKKNLMYLRRAKKACNVIITAWGVAQVVKKLNPAKTLKVLETWETYSLGHCKDGTPRHPLYLRKGTDLVKNESFLKPR